MSTGKRIAKRSIIGTRVVAPGIDGRFYPATIQSTKHYETFQQDSQRYLVKFDNSRKVCEFGETELVGPGFAGVSAIGTLMNGQRVYLTHGGREMEGTVLHHDERADIVTVNLAVSFNPLDYVTRLWIMLYFLLQSFQLLSKNKNIYTH